MAGKGWKTFGRKQRICTGEHEREEKEEEYPRALKQYLVRLGENEGNDEAVYKRYYRKVYTSRAERFFYKTF